MCETGRWEDWRGGIIMGSGAAEAADGDVTTDDIDLDDREAALALGGSGKSSRDGVIIGVESDET